MGEILVYSSTWRSPIPVCFMKMVETDPKWGWYRGRARPYRLDFRVALPTLTNVARETEYNLFIKTETFIDCLKLKNDVCPNPCCFIFTFVIDYTSDFIFKINLYSFGKKYTQLWNVIYRKDGSSCHGEGDQLSPGLRIQYLKNDQWCLIYFSFLAAIFSFGQIRSFQPTTISIIS